MKWEHSAPNQGRLWCDAARVMSNVPAWENGKEREFHVEGKSTLASLDGADSQRLLQGSHAAG